MINVIDLGLINYSKALEIQMDLLKKRIEGEISDTLLLAEHDPVVTLGRVEEEGDITDRSFFNDGNIPFISTGRGGGVTYHAPGQLIMYPIISLQETKKDVVSYINFLEKTISKGFATLGISVTGGNKKRGVWAGDKKIAFIGIAVKKWITYHGVSININNDTEAFLNMNPCGEKDISVTSAREYAGKSFDMAGAKEAFSKQFIEDFQSEYREACLEKCC